MIKCAIVGGSGYIGGELIRILLAHPHVDLVSVTANEMAGKPIGSVHPNLRHININFQPLNEVNEAEVLFLALPSGKAMKVIQQFSTQKIIDTSADFRLRDKLIFEKFYKTEHFAFDKTANFTYGLPELFREKIKVANHIAAPGCFATAAILSLYPLVAEKLAQDIFINAVTGSSGSGSKLKETVHHPFRADSYFAYELFTHRHIPEIKQALKDSTGFDTEIIFQPHSGPFVRGIYATAMIKLNREITKEQLSKIFKDYYADEYFVRLGEGSPNMKWVQGTNFCDIGIETDGKTAIVMTTIDNLLKGGAAQAIQCFNIMHDFAENTGLQLIGSNP